MPGFPASLPQPEPLTFRAFQFNARWPGFSSTPKTPTWAARCSTLAAIAKAQDASVIVAQELGQQEAVEFFAALGQPWRYDRAGLNIVGWRSDRLTYQKSTPVNLTSFGQMQRTLLAVELATGSDKVRVASTHLAAAASDLTATQAIVARSTQAAEIAAALALNPMPTLLGADWNSRTADDNGPAAPRSILAALGWKFDQTDLTNDAKSGIDGTAANYGLRLDSSAVVDLGLASDHDGRLVVATTS